MMLAFAQSMSGEELELALRAMQARGRDATPGGICRSASLHTCNQEWTRLLRLAGVDAAAGTAAQEDDAG